MPETRSPIASILIMRACMSPTFCAIASRFSRMILSRWALSSCTTSFTSWLTTGQPSRAALRKK